MKKIIQKALSFFNYRLENIKYKNYYNINEINLNIGSGRSTFPNFINLDKKSWRSEGQLNYISYDITTDKIPFKNDTVSNIYCSNVIEHLENKHVEFFFKECLRVLKKNGVLRLITPDSEFLYKNLFFKSSYWDWFKASIQSFNKKNYNHNLQIENFDCFIFHFAQQKSRFYQKYPDQEYYEFLKSLKYEDLMEELKKGLKFNVNTISEHINYFDFKKTKEFLEKASKLNDIKFYFILCSKKNGSVSSIMREKIFDYSSHARSLYVDYLKEPDK